MHKEIQCAVVASYRNGKVISVWDQVYTVEQAEEAVRSYNSFGGELEARMATMTILAEFLCDFDCDTE